MKAAHLNPFINSTSKIIRDNTGAESEMGKPFLRPKYPYTTESVAIIIGVTGHLSGQVVISIEEECARALAAAMLMEPSLPEFDEYAQSALAELGNMIVANATIGLAEVGCICDITPPSLITGKRMEITNPPKIQTIAVPLVLEKGKIELNLSLIENV